MKTTLQKTPQKSLNIARLTLGAGASLCLLAASALADTSPLSPGDCQHVMRILGQDDSKLALAERELFIELGRAARNPDIERIALVLEALVHAQQIFGQLAEKRSFIESHCPGMQ